MSSSSSTSSVPNSTLPPAPTTEQVTFKVGPLPRTPECIVCQETIVNDEKGNKEIAIRVEYIKPWKYSETTEPHTPKFFAHCKCFVRSAFRLQDEKSVGTKNAYRKGEPCQPYVFHNLDEEIQGFSSYPQLRSIFQPLLHSITNEAPLPAALSPASVPVSITDEVAAVLPVVQEQKQLPSAPVENTAHYQPINVLVKSLHRTSTTLKSWCENGVKYYRRPEGHGNFYVDPVSARCMHTLHALGEKKCFIVSCDGTSDSPDEPMVIQCTLDGVPITVTIQPTPTDTAPTASTDESVSTPVASTNATHATDMPATATAAAATAASPPPPSKSVVSASNTSLSKAASVPTPTTVDPGIRKTAAPATVTAAKTDHKSDVKKGSSSSVKPVTQKRRASSSIENESDSKAETSSAEQSNESVESKSQHHTKRPCTNNSKSVGLHNK